MGLILEAGEEARGEFDRSRSNARVSRQRALEIVWLPKQAALCFMGMKIFSEEASSIGISSSDSSTSVSNNGLLCFSSPENCLRVFGFVWWSACAFNHIDADITERLTAD